MIQVMLGVAAVVHKVYQEFHSNYFLANTFAHSHAQNYIKRSGGVFSTQLMTYDP